MQPPFPLIAKMIARIMFRVSSNAPVEVLQRQDILMRSYYRDARCPLFELFKSVDGFGGVHLLKLVGRGSPLLSLVNRVRSTPASGL